MTIDEINQKNLKTHVDVLVQRSSQQICKFCTCFFFWFSGINLLVFLQLFSTYHYATIHSHHQCHSIKSKKDAIQVEGHEDVRII